MPGWNSIFGGRIYAIITRVVPDVREAVKWNSPLYGVEEHMYFLGMHCLTNYVMVAFVRGASLKPMSPSRHENAP
jgi:hypothetical protein